MATRTASSNGRPQARSDTLAAGLKGVALAPPERGTGTRTPAKRGGTAAKPKAASAAPRALEATALLRADHQAVSALFEQYDKARSTDRKQALAKQICDELTVHAQIEEEIFYPAVKAAMKDRELVPEAIVEHATLKELVAQIQGQAPGDEMYDAKVKVLSEYVKHHVKEEQNEMFPRAKKTKLDLKALGEQLAQRKEELKAQQAPR